MRAGIAGWAAGTGTGGGAGIPGGAGGMAPGAAYSTGTAGIGSVGYATSHAPWLGSGARGGPGAAGAPGASSAAARGAGGASSGSSSGWATMSIGTGWSFAICSVSPGSVVIASTLGARCQCQCGWPRPGSWSSEAVRVLVRSQTRPDDVPQKRGCARRRPTPRTGRGRPSPARATRLGGGPRLKGGGSPVRSVSGQSVRAPLHRAAYRQWQHPPCTHTADGQPATRRASVARSACGRRARRLSASGRAQECRRIVQHR